MPFLSDLTLTTVPGDGELFKLERDLCYQGRHETFTVPAGFVTDLASVPGYLTWLAPRYGVYTRAAVLHDYLCVEAHAGRFSRRDADGVFKRVMREMGVSHPRRWMMWGAVRVGGHFAGGVGSLDVVRLAAVFLFVVPFILLPTLLVAFFQAIFAAIEVNATYTGRQVEEMEERRRRLRPPRS